MPLESMRMWCERHSSVRKLQSMHVPLVIRATHQWLCFVLFFPSIHHFLQLIIKSCVFSASVFAIRNDFCFRSSLKSLIGSLQEISIPGIYEIDGIFSHFLHVKVKKVRSTIKCNLRERAEKKYSKANEDLIIFNWIISKKWPKTHMKSPSTSNLLNVTPPKY